MQKITPFLWFDGRAEEAAEFYVSLFEDAKIVDTTHYPEGAPPPAPADGGVMTVTFQLAGQEYMALNGGPDYSLTPAFSLFVHCRDQREIDRLWNALTDGGEEQPCGWLVDRFGVSWQIVPEELVDLIGGDDPERSRRVLETLWKMQKIEIQPLRDAAAA